MTQILLISNDETANSLYPININLYLGADVTVKTSLNEAKKILDNKAHLDLIITLNFEAVNLVNYLTSLNLTLPLIILGELNLQDKEQFSQNPNIVMVDSKLKLQDVIKTIAKIFNITAQIMVKKKVPEHFPIPMKLFSKLSRITTEVYIIDGEVTSVALYLQIAERGDIIEKVLRVCKAKKVETIFIPSSERFKIISEISSKLLVELADPTMKTGKKLELNEMGFELVGNQIGDLQVINEEILILHKTCIESSTEIVRKIPKLKDLLDDLLKNKSGFVYTHSILTSFVCSQMVKHLPWGGQSHSDKLAYISFYHDLFLIPLYKKYPQIVNEEDFLKLEDIENDEYEMVLGHAKMIGEMISKFPRTPIGSDVILRQHHGEHSGIGFATDFKEDISPLAKVFIIGEAYVMEILRGQNYPTDAKLNLSRFNKNLVIEKLNARFSRVSYKKIVETLDKVAL